MVGAYRRRGREERENPRSLQDMVGTIGGREENNRKTLGAHRLA